jgi:predicted amidohydrolase
VKLALLQMRVEPGAKAPNLQRASVLVSQAAEQGAQIVVLPEAMPLGWMDSSTGQLADEIPGGDSCQFLCELAARHQLHLCSGIVERSGQQIFNSAILVDPAGRILLHHRKLNELEIAHACYAQGDRLAVARTPLGAIGVMICSDAFAEGHVVSRTLGLMGADIIVSPCAWAVPADHDNRREPYGQLWRDCYGPVARDFQIWIAGVSNVGPIRGGPWAGRNCIGNSLLVGPDGRQILQGPYGPEAETILHATIELQPRPARRTPG